MRQFCIWRLSGDSFFTLSLRSTVRPFERLFSVSHGNHDTSIKERDAHVNWSRRHHACWIGLWVKKNKEGPLFTMATGTLPSVVSRYKVAIITLFLSVYMDVFDCQQFVIPFKSPSDCSGDEFFDISSLSCVSCGSNQLRSTTGRLPLHNNSCSILTICMPRKTCGLSNIFNFNNDTNSHPRPNKSTMNWVTVS